MTPGAVMTAAELLRERESIVRAMAALAREDRPIDVHIETLGNRMKDIKSQRFLRALTVMVEQIDQHLVKLGVEPPPS